VNLVTSMSCLGVAGITSQTELVANVTLLADCLYRSTGLEGCGDAAGHAAAVNKALITAIEVERRLAEMHEKITYMERLAMTDELTGLLNRRGFADELTHVLAAARRYREKGVLIYVDLDGFKPINDSYGHAAGDEVLRQIGRILHDCVRETDYVARLGGDEFAVLLTRTLWDDGLHRAECLDETLNKAVVVWEGRLIAVRASLGIQAYGANDDGRRLLHQADEAMYRTKRSRAQLQRLRATA
jgi:diguanylate cyclase (GGDEF)-like protein